MYWLCPISILCLVVKLRLFSMLRTEQHIMTSQELKQKRISRWYFGGLASAGAACCTHPLDLIKVTLQTQQEGKVSMLQLTGKIVRQQGQCWNWFFPTFIRLIFKNFCFVLKVSVPYTTVYRRRCFVSSHTLPLGLVSMKWVSNRWTRMLVLRAKYC